MFNLTHVLYLIISLIVTVVFLTLTGIFVKSERHKKNILKIISILTIVLHYSDVYVHFFKTGTAKINSSHLLPIYPCNIIMWLLLICSFLKKHDSKVAKCLLEFTFYAGVVCGTIGVVFNENYGNNPTLADWDIFKGLLSHSTMIIGCIYILVAKWIKIRVSNCISVFLGLCFFIIDGFIINGLYSIFNLGECNAMYLQTPPFENAPWFGPWIMGMIGLILVFIITALTEQFTLKKEERWNVLIKEKIHSRN